MTPNFVPGGEQDDRDISFKVYKGIVSLQAGAVKYHGILSEEGLDKSRLRKGLRELVSDISEGELVANFYNVAELARRMSCVREDYVVLGEDIEEGFEKIFDESLLRQADINSLRSEHPDLAGATNEFDLALCRTYWKNLGIDDKTLDTFVSRIPRDDILGDYREEIFE